MRSDNIKGHMIKSESRFKAAQLLYDHGFFDEASGMAYYSVLHAINAVLAIDAISYKKHKQVLGYFNQQYIHTGKIGGISVRVCVQLFEGRNNSEYDPAVFGGQDGATEALRLAQLAIKEITNFFESRNIPE